MSESTQWAEVPLKFSVALPVTILLRKCRTGDREAQQQLYLRYRHSAYRLLVRMVGQNDADDLLQEVFLQVLRTLSQFNGQAAIPGVSFFPGIKPDLVATVRKRGLQSRI